MPAFPSAGRTVRGGALYAPTAGIHGRPVAPLLFADPDAVISRAARENHGHRPSMLQDVLAGRPTEIAALNGGIVVAGEAAGVPTPLHAAIAALVAGREAQAPSIE